MWCISNNNRPTPNATQAMTICYLLNRRLAGRDLGKWVTQLARFESLVEAHPAQSALARDHDAVRSVGHGALAGRHEVGMRRRAVGGAVPGADRLGDHGAFLAGLLTDGVLEPGDGVDQCGGLAAALPHQLGEPVGEVED